MKKIISIILALALTAGLAACGDSTASTTAAATTEAATTEAPTTEEVTTEAGTEAATEAEGARNTKAPDSTEGNLVVTFFGNNEVDSSVTWGDCSLMKMPDESYVLVDACEGGYETHIVETIKAEGISHIETAIISHYHSDHYGGLDTFIKEFGIKTIYIDGFELDESISWNTNASELAAWITKHQDMGLTVNTVMAGDSFELGGAQFNVLFPTQDTEANTTNDTSIVFNVCYGGKKILFSGDLYYAGESACLKEVDDELLKADVLKIMHHGANTSGSEEFITAVSPVVAANMGNHIMNNLAVYRYTKIGCTVYQTWETGDVHVMITDGEDDMYVWCQK